MKRIVLAVLVALSVSLIYVYSASAMRAPVIMMEGGGGGVRDRTPPILTAVSPQTTTYSFTTDLTSVSFDYILQANEPLYWAHYSVDGSPEQPLTYNPLNQKWEALSASPPLIRGPHSVLFSAMDNSGNRANITIPFTIFLETTASDCASASAKLNGNWDKVKLIQSISDQPGTCIVFNADNVIFDGNKDQGIIIDGDNSGSGDGVDFNGRSGNTVQNSEIKEYGSGIVSILANNNEIIYNSIHHNVGDGVIINRANNNEIKQNVFQSNGGNGIYFSGILSGIYSGLIENNSIRSNLDNGIRFYSNVDNVIVIDNLFWGNGNDISDYAIRIESTGSQNNVLFHNMFRNNNLLVYDNGVNQWYTEYPVGGNYWYDYDSPVEGCIDSYSGIDQLQLGSDGICDDPYPFGILDNYPWVTERGWL